MSYKLSTAQSFSLAAALAVHLAGLVSSARATITITALGPQAGVTSSNWITAGDTSVGALDWGSSTTPSTDYSAVGSASYVAGVAHQTSNSAYSAALQWTYTAPTHGSGVVTNTSGGYNAEFEVTAAGTYDLKTTGGNVTGDTATAAGQILQWTVSTNTGTLAGTDFYVDQNGGGQVGAIGLTAVPEPGSVVIWGFATVMGLLGATRRRHRKT
jgi:hypothetical protein